MWNTLALSLPGQGAVTIKAARKPRPWLRLAVYSASIAAVLLVAAQLGSLQYGGDMWIPGLPSLSRAREMSVRGLGTSIKQYAAASSRELHAPGFLSSNEGLVGLRRIDDTNNSTMPKRNRYSSFAAPGEGVGRAGDRPSDAQLDAAAMAARSAAPQVMPSPAAPIPGIVDRAEIQPTPLPARMDRELGIDDAPRKLSGLGYVSASSASSGKWKAAMTKAESTAPPDGRADFERTDELVQRMRRLSGAPALDAAFCIDSGIPGETQPASGGGGATGQAAEGEQASNVPASAKIIRTGLLNIEVPVYANVATQVEQMVAAHRGFIGDSNVVEQTGGAIVGTVVIRVAAEQFEGLFAALKGLGRVVSEHSDSDDVTAAYVDLEARIVSQRVTEERLHDLVRNKTIVDKVSALLEVERELQRVRSDIERMQGELRVMADRVALSTITLTLSEPKRIVPTASLSVEVGTVDEAGASLGATLTTLNGRLLSGKTHKRSDGTLMATYQLQVPLSRFNELLDAVAAMGRIEERQISDHEFSAVKEPWAANVQCSVALTVFERSRQQPSGTMFVEAGNLEEAVKKLETVLEPTAARIVSSYSVVDPQGASKAEVSLSVPALNFSELVERLGQLGRVQSQSITGETKNASGGAASVLCSIRLMITEVVREVPTGQIIVEVAKFDAARAAVATLVGEKSLQVLDSSSQQNVDGSWRANFELGVEAKDMEEVVGRLEGLGRVASRNMQGIGLGSLSRTDPKALGHLSVSIAEKSAIAPAPEQAGQTLRTHLRDGLEGLYKSVGLIAYGLIVMGPWLAIAILIGWLIGRVRGRRKTNGTSGSAVP